VSATVHLRIIDETINPMMRLSSHSVGQAQRQAPQVAQTSHPRLFHVGHPSAVTGDTLDANAVRVKHKSVAQQFELIRLTI
jgi:hypothetical protein